MQNYVDMKGRGHWEQIHEGEGQSKACCTLLLG